MKHALCLSLLGVTWLFSLGATPGGGAPCEDTKISTVVKESFDSGYMMKVDEALHEDILERLEPVWEARQRRDYAGLLAAEYEEPPEGWQELIECNAQTWGKMDLLHWEYEGLRFRGANGEVSVKVLTRYQVRWPAGSGECFDLVTEEVLVFKDGKWEFVWDKNCGLTFTPW